MSPEEELIHKFDELRAQRWDKAIERESINDLLADLANEITILYLFLNEPHKSSGFKDF